MARITCRFSLPGPPLSKKNAVAHLVAHNVTVGLGTEEAWNARNLRFDIAWVGLPEFKLRTTY